MNWLNNSEIRRQDRAIGAEDAAKVLREANYATLAMPEMRGDVMAAYCVPLSYVWDGANVIYFHGAVAGHKLDCLALNPWVAVSIVGDARVMPWKFTTSYISVLLRGRIRTDLSEEEKQNSMEMVLDKYCPDFREGGLKYIAEAISRIVVMRLDIESGSAKGRAYEDQFPGAGLGPIIGGAPHAGACGPTGHCPGK